MNVARRIGRIVVIASKPKTPAVAVYWLVAPKPKCSPQPSRPARERALPKVDFAGVDFGGFFRLPVV